MRAALRLSAFALALWLGTAACACLPDPPGTPPPPVRSEEEKARDAANWATDIVYGVVLRAHGDGPARFRVLHVYKGALRRGAVIEAEAGWGLDPPMCAGMIQPVPVPPGSYGVIYFRGDDRVLNLLSDNAVAFLIREGLIRSARAGGPGPH